MIAFVQNLTNIDCIPMKKTKLRCPEVLCVAFFYSLLERVHLQSQSYLAGPKQIVLIFDWDELFQ